MKAQIELPPKLLPVLPKIIVTKVLMVGEVQARLGHLPKCRQCLLIKEQCEGKVALFFAVVSLWTHWKKALLKKLNRRSSLSLFSKFFDVGEKYVRTKDGRISYVFSGLRHNLDSIKSKARILIAWIDEAETVSETAWRKLIPTVRENNSEIWVTWNPENRGSATDTRFQAKSTWKQLHNWNELPR